MMPPVVTAWFRALKVQLAAVPVPTTVVGLEVLTGVPCAGTPALHDPFGLPAVQPPEELLEELLDVPPEELLDVPPEELLDVPPEELLDVPPEELLVAPELVPDEVPEPPPEELPELETDPLPVVPPPLPGDPRPVPPQPLSAESSSDVTTPPNPTHTKPLVARIIANPSRDTLRARRGRDNGRVGRAAREAVTGNAARCRSRRRCRRSRAASCR
jgi:hypothetical protein